MNKLGYYANTVNISVYTYAYVNLSMLFNRNTACNIGTYNFRYKGVFMVQRHQHNRFATLALPLVLLSALLLFASAPSIAVAKDSVAQVTNMQVLVSGTEKSPSTVEIYASTNATKFPAVVDVMLPADGTILAAEQFSSDSNKRTKIDFRSTPSDIDTKTDVMYQVKLTEASNFVITLKISYSAYADHNMGDTPVASFGLVAPCDLKEVAYGFVALKGTMGIGKDTEAFADSKKGKVYGVRYQNVKRGMMSTASVAFIDEYYAKEQMKKASAEDPKLTAAKKAQKKFELVLYSLIGALVLAIIFVVFLVVRRRINK